MRPKRKRVFFNLSVERVEAIRQVLAYSSLSQIDIARASECSPRTVMRIANGSTWKRTFPTRDYYHCDPDSYLDTNMIATEEKNDTTTSAVNKDGDCCPSSWVFNPTMTQVTSPINGKTYAVTLTPGSPPILKDPEGRINKGKPTSVFDLIYEFEKGKKLKGKHAVPKDRNYAVCSADLCDYDLLSPKAIHKEYQEKQTRGRKTQITVDQAAAIKSSVFHGGAKPGELVDLEDYGCLSLPTINKIVKGEAFWYA